MHLGLALPFGDIGGDGPIVREFAELAEAEGYPFAKDYLEGLSDYSSGYGSPTDPKLADLQARAKAERWLSPFEFYAAETRCCRGPAPASAPDSSGMAGTSARIRGAVTTGAVARRRPRCARQAMAAAPPAMQTPTSTSSSVGTLEPDSSGAGVAVRAGAARAPAGCCRGLSG